MLISGCWELSKVIRLSFSFFRQQMMSTNLEHQSFQSMSRRNQKSRKDREGRERQKQKRKRKQKRRRRRQTRIQTRTQEMFKRRQPHRRKTPRRMRKTPTNQTESRRRPRPRAGRRVEETTRNRRQRRRQVLTDKALLQICHLKPQTDRHKQINCCGLTGLLWGQSVSGTVCSGNIMNILTDS